MATRSSTLTRSPKDCNCDKILEELKVVVTLLQQSTQPIEDNNDHLAPFCELLEAAFTKGLKSPNSVFGLNKETYWNWIVSLDQYYFNNKHNPVLQKTIEEVASCLQVHRPIGRGRCFIRASLNTKIISVPVEQLVKNHKLTNFWYGVDSIINQEEYKRSLMSILFEVTAVDFTLNQQHSSFLDETWIIPSFQRVVLPPLKTLDLQVCHVDQRILVVAIEKGCLAQQGGVAPGDIIDEFGGQLLHDPPKGKLLKILRSCSSGIALQLVKHCLPSGDVFPPIHRRKLLYESSIKQSSSQQQIGRSKLARLFSASTSYPSSIQHNLVYLGKVDNIKQSKVMSAVLYCVVNKLLNGSTGWVQSQFICEPSDHVITSAIDKLLKESTSKPQPVVLKLNSFQSISLLDDKEHSLFASFVYSEICSCAVSAHHPTCIGLLTGAGVTLLNDTTPLFSCTVLEAPSPDQAILVCQQIAEGFQKTTWFVPAS